MAKCSKMKNRDIYSCALCKLKFRNQDNLVSHMKACKGNLVVVCCKYCNRVFTNKSIAEHLTNCEKKYKTYICNKCKLQFRAIHKLQNHLKICTEKSTLMCKYCDKVFAESHFDWHQRKCIKKEIYLGNTEFEICKYCKKSFLKRIIKKHEVYCPENENRIVARYQCDKCKTKFKRKDYLIPHMKRCKGHKGQVMCLYKTCSEHFKNKLALVEHIRESHTDEQTVNKPQLLNFNGLPDFLRWKDEEEERTFSYFSRRNGSRNGKYYYYCQHDGSAKPHVRKGELAPKTRKRHLYGSARSGKTCIAMIHLKINTDGTCFAKYFSTHSHPLNIKDWTYQPQKRCVYEEIDKQIALQIPPANIVKNIVTLENTNVNEVKKSQLITKNLINLRARKFSQLCQKIYEQSGNNEESGTEINCNSDDSKRVRINKPEDIISPDDAIILIVDENDNLNKEGEIDSPQFFNFSSHQNVFEGYNSDKSGLDNVKPNSDDKHFMIKVLEKNCVSLVNLVKIESIPSDTSSLPKKSLKNMPHSESLDNVNSMNESNVLSTEVKKSKPLERRLKRKLNKRFSIPTFEKNIKKEDITGDEGPRSYKNDSVLISKSDRGNEKNNISQVKFRSDKGLIKDFENSRVKEHCIVERQYEPFTARDENDKISLESSEMLAKGNGFIKSEMSNVLLSHDYCKIIK